MDFRDVLPDGNYLWLASSGGLVRYDLITGEWKIWTKADGLSDNALESLTEQGDWLWIGSQGGVSRFNRRTEEWDVYTTKNGLSSNHNVNVFFDGKTVWAGTLNGLSWFDPVLDKWESIFSAGEIDLAGVESLLSDDTFLWISVEPGNDSSGGILRWNRTSGEWTRIGQKAGEPPVQSYTLTQNDELLWAAPKDGLPWEYNKKSGRWRQVTEIEPEGVPDGAFYQGANFYAGALWIYATHTGELVRYDSVTHRTSKYPAPRLANLEMLGQAAGQSTTLWFAGQNGLLAFYLETGEWRSLRQGLGSVFKILGQRGASLLLDTDLGPGFWEPESDEWKPLAPVGGLGRTSPNGAALDNEGQSVWLAQLAGNPDDNQQPRLLYYSKPGVEPLHYNITPPAGWEVLELLSRPQGNTLWFVGTHGFLSYNPAVDQWGVYELSENVFLDIHTMNQQGTVVWFATANELGNFDANTGTYSVVPMTVPVTFQLALAVGEDQLWMLADDGLYQGTIDGDEWTMVEISAPCLDQATQLVYWENAWWVGGANGVGRIELQADSWVCFTPANGMMDKEFEQMFPTSNALWFSHPGRGIWRYKSQ
ncbi:MAG: hypothetical protein JXA42_26960 [Anaerolineales bacterium]|nr:hypothetical protein [Anaerolineales bacterium]